MTKASLTTTNSRISLMAIPTQQRLLSLLAIVALIGAGGAIYWSTSDLASGVSASQRDKTAGTELDFADSSGAENSDWSLALRSPLYDPPPKADPAPRQVPTKPKTKPPARPSLNMTLVGTIIDSDGSLAIIADQNGKFDVKGEGDSLELSPPGVRIGQIGSETITLEYEGATSTIRLEKEKQNNKPVGNGNGRNRNRRRIP